MIYRLNKKQRITIYSENGKKFWWHPKSMNLITWEEDEEEDEEVEGESEEERRRRKELYTYIN